MRPSCPKAIKLYLRRVIRAFYADLTAIIILSPNALTKCPLNCYRAARQMFSENLNKSLISSTSIDFAKPLCMALDKLTNKTAHVNK